MYKLTLTKTILQCCCLNSSNYKVDVIHRIVTHLEPDICTEAKANYSGHLEKFLGTLCLKVVIYKKSRSKFAACATSLPAKINKLETIPLDH